MIAGELARRRAAHPERALVQTEAACLSYAEAGEAIERIRADLAVLPGARVGLRGPVPWLLLHLLAIDSLGVRAYLLPPGGAPAGEDLAVRLRLHVILDGAGGRRERDAGGECDGVPGEVVLFSSGTTGQPKGVLHTWRTLASRVRVRDELEGSRWLLTYDLATFAGLQVALHALLNGGTLVAATDPAALSPLAAAAGVTHVSGTPSFFRWWLGTAREEEVSGLRPRQLTLGGEPVTEGVLGALAERFPGVPIAQVYATTELGACFSVHDGKAGFPARLLTEPPPGVDLRIEEGELWIRSSRAMLGYLEAPATASRDGFVATGDLVEPRGDRIVFLGRRSERINVGGRKVDPLEVEEVLLEMSAVRAARVSAAASSLVGALVRARVVWSGEGDAADARRSILRHCRERLPAHMVPRVLDLVDSLEQTPSGKLSRR